MSDDRDADRDGPDPSRLRSGAARLDDEPDARAVADSILRYPYGEPKVRLDP